MCEHIRARLLQETGTKRRRLSQQTYLATGTDADGFLQSGCPECANAQQSSSAPQPPPIPQGQESKPANTSAPPPSPPDDFEEVDDADTELSAPPPDAPRRQGVFNRFLDFLRSGSLSRSNSRSRPRTNQQSETGLDDVVLSLADLSKLDSDLDQPRGQDSPQVRASTAPHVEPAAPSGPLPADFPEFSPAPIPVPRTGGPPPPFPQPNSVPPLPQEPLLPLPPRSPAPAPRSSRKRPSNRRTTRDPDDHSRIAACKELLEDLSAEYGGDQPGGFQEGDGHTCVTSKLEPILEGPSVVLCAQLEGSDSDSSDSDGGREDSQERDKLVPIFGNPRLKNIGQTRGVWYFG